MSENFETTLEAVQALPEKYRVLVVKAMIKDLAAELDAENVTKLFTDKFDIDTDELPVLVEDVDPGLRTVIDETGVNPFEPAVGQLHD